MVSAVTWTSHTTVYSQGARVAGARLRAACYHTRLLIKLTVDCFSFLSCCVVLCCVASHCVALRCVVFCSFLFFSFFHVTCTCRHKAKPWLKASTDGAVKQTFESHRRCIWVSISLGKGESSPPCIGAQQSSPSPFCQAWELLDCHTLQCKPDTSCEVAALSL